MKSVSHLFSVLLKRMRTMNTTDPHHHRRPFSKQIKVHKMGITCPMERRPKREVNDEEKPRKKKCLKELIEQHLFIRDKFLS